jgi:hypothetical protein
MNHWKSPIYSTVTESSSVVAWEKWELTGKRIQGNFLGVREMFYRLLEIMIIRVHEISKAH